MSIALRPPSRQDGLMGLRAFKRFTDLRPDEERWELRDGIPVMNPTPTNFHQIIVSNLLFELGREARRQGDRWHVFPGTNVVPDTEKPNAPIPDVAARFGDPLHSSFLTDIVLAVEVISPDSRRRDLERKPLLYAAIASLAHYVVVDTRSPVITLFDRAAGFAPRAFSDPDQPAPLPAIGSDLRPREIYRQTGLIR
jgi:Uma2 family endonuclease